jgi:cell division protein FtsA
MNDKNVIVGLDIGTTKVCTVVGIQSGKSSEQDIEIIGVGTHPSHGLKKGSVVNIEKTVKSIKSSLEEARLMSGINISKASIGIAGNHIYSFNSSGVVAIKGREIDSYDVKRVIEAAKAVVIPSDREILHVVPQSYKVDNTSDIKNPIGMCGIRLEAQVHIVTGSISLIQNLVKCVENAGVTVSQIILQPIASSRAVLAPEEKELGVVLVDIGGGTTDLAIWKNGSLVHSHIIPVGGNHFTNDLAVALQIPHTEAETIKVNHASVIPEGVGDNSCITVQGLSGTRPREVKLQLVADVLGSRAEELFSIIKEIIRERGLSHEINGGYVLTGGGSLIKSLADLGEYILERPTKTGHPLSLGGMTRIMHSPKFSTVLGLLLEAKKKKVNFVENNRRRGHKDLISRLSESLRSVFKEIF